MLLKTTNHCQRGCSHCSESSTPAGQHMTEDMFLAALEFSKRIDGPAWSMGYPPLILLSGGECTEHPKIEWMVQTVLDQKLMPVLITNGMWLNDPILKSSLLRKEWNLFVQVTYDPRYYPPPGPPRIDDPRIVYIDSLSVLVPLGRLKMNKPHEIRVRKGPTSFNLRSATRALRSFVRAVTMQRVRASNGLSGHCTPSVCEDGRVNIGETRACWTIGTVDSTESELTKAVLEMGECNRCGLETDLTKEQRRAIGLDLIEHAHG